MAAPSGAYQLIRPATATTTALVMAQVWVPIGTAIEVTRSYVNQGSSTTSGGVEIATTLATAAGTGTLATPTFLGQMQASRCVGGTTATQINQTIAGTLTNNLDDQGVNVLNGYLYFPVPEARQMIVNSAARGVALRTVTAPASVNFVAGIDYLEY